MIEYFQRKAMKLSMISSQVGGLQVSLIVGGLYMIPGAVAQYGFGASYRYDCDKYCFASCSDYHGSGGPEFSACVQANVHCNCVTKFSYRNPFILFALLAGVMILISLCGMCYRWASKGDRIRTPHSIVAQPVTSNSRGNGAHIIANSRLGNSQTRSSQTSPRPSFVIPMGGSPGQKLDDLPPEYLPPPEYSSCVLTVEGDAREKERF